LSHAIIPRTEIKGREPDEQKTQKEGGENIPIKKSLPETKQA
jgi:hypothetical protein